MYHVYKQLCTCNIKRDTVSHACAWELHTKFHRCFRKKVWTIKIGPRTKQSAKQHIKTKQSVKTNLQISNGHILSFSTILRAVFCGLPSLKLTVRPLKNRPPPKKGSLSTIHLPGAMFKLLGCIHKQRTYNFKGFWLKQVKLDSDQCGYTMDTWMAISLKLNPLLSSWANMAARICRCCCKSVSSLWPEDHWEYVIAWLGGTEIPPTKSNKISVFYTTPPPNPWVVWGTFRTWVWTTPPPTRTGFGL